MYALTERSHKKERGNTSYKSRKQNGNENQIIKNARKHLKIRTTPHVLLNAERSVATEPLDMASYVGQHSH